MKTLKQLIELWRRNATLKRGNQFKTAEQSEYVRQREHIQQCKETFCRDSGEPEVEMLNDAYNQELLLLEARKQLNLIQ